MVVVESSIRWHSIVGNSEHSSDRQFLLAGRCDLEVGFRLLAAMIYVRGAAQTCEAPLQLSLDAVENDWRTFISESLYRTYF